jgi:polysaccharide biosynthesis transport protein
MLTTAHTNSAGEPPRTPNPVTAGSGFDWREYYYAIRSRAWIVILCLILFTFWGFYKASKLHQEYKARAVLFIVQEKNRILSDRVADVHNDSITSVDMINTLIELFQSYPFALRVANRLKLAQDPEFLAAAGLHGSDISPEQVAFSLTGMIDAEFRLNTRLIDMFATTQNPKVSEKVANAYAQEYFFYHQDEQRASTHSAATFLVDESERLRKKMRTAEEGMQAFRERERAASIESMLENAQRQLGQLTEHESEIKAKVTQIDSDLTIAQAHKNDTEELLRLPSVANDGKVAALVAQLQSLENELSVVKQRYRSKHPVYINLQTRINLTRQQLNKVLEDVVNLLQSMKLSLTAQQNATKIEKDAAEKHLLDVTSKTIEYNDLKRELESDAALYASVINRIKEVDITKELSESPLQIREPAMGAYPVGVLPQKIIINAILLGLAIGIGITLGLHKLDSSMKTVDQVELATGLVVVAAIPQVGYEEKDSTSFALGLLSREQWKEVSAGFQSAFSNFARKRGRSLATRLAETWDILHPVLTMITNPRRITALPQGSALVVKEERSGIVAEAFRDLRATIAMNDRMANQRSFLFTSALPSEGKSFSSANFSTTLAHQGLRTLLIDADLRKPSISRLFFGMNRKPGLSEVLLGTIPLSQAVVSSGIQDLTILTAGGRSEKPSELLAGEPFRELMEEALLTYDRVVVDSAPLLPVSDTLLVAHSVDILCLVVRSFMTPRKMVTRAIKLLSEIHITPAGIVLNCLPTGSGSSYDYYYGRHYGSYGTYGSKGVYGSM